LTPVPALDDLVGQLRAHRCEDDAEARDVARVLEFVARHPDPFDRRIPEGHLTGSAFVVARGGTRVLLLHHRKLDRWLQPGGHADPGEQSGEAVALREVREETGLGAVQLHPAAPRPLDVDVHEIPARPGEPAHAHLDLRYLAVAEAAALVRAEQEADDLKWFSWDELPALRLDAGLRRGLSKALRYVGPGRNIGHDERA
jgi:8-oxo-dGTP pyrophosphatase MutT (NUDIX family)